MSDPYGFDSPEYYRFLADCAKDCRCCSCCQQCPCAGVTAGGFCDEFKCVHEGDEYDRSEEDFYDDGED